MCIFLNFGNNLDAGYLVDMNNANVEHVADVFQLHTAYGMDSNIKAHEHLNSLPMGGKQSIWSCWLTEWKPGHIPCPESVEKTVWLGKQNSTYPHRLDSE